MRISVNWLREMLPGLEGDPAAVADRLSSRAVPVDEVVSVGEGLEDLVVARVEETRPHPNADRLTLCRVDPGEGDPVGVVCGAPVIREGVHYAWVPPGGRLPGGMEVEAREIRGEESAGMLCSEHELGLGPDESGILPLPAGVRPGERLTEALGLPDTCLVLDLTPNRVDLACHLGVARELAAAGQEPTLRTLEGPDWSPRWSDGADRAAASGVEVTVEAPDRCPRYLGAVVRGVEVGPSPAWLSGRLRALGARPVNNVVDATNYVLHELNQPLHAFDLDTLEGPEVRVRPARSGEELRTLDGEERVLGPEATVIADASSAVGLAGVMGGEESEVTGRTRDVFLECASFDPSSTRSTARAVDLTTDASYRFERGVDPRGQERALARCVELILATAGGEPPERGLRVGGARPRRREVTLRTSRVRQVLGRDVPPPQLRRLLEPLGFEESSGGGDARSGPSDARLAFRVPGWRGDVEREIDLVEEVARRRGYESFPTERRSFRPSTVPSDPAWDRAARVRRWMAARGLLEARSLSLVPKERVDGGRAVPIPNPLSEDEDHLRDALVPPLLDRVEHNFARGRRSVRLYEIGTAFRRREGGPDAEAADRLPAEEIRAGAVLTGLRRPEHWSGEAEPVDLWDLKALAEEVAEVLVGGELIAASDPPGEYAGVVPLEPERWLGAERFWIREAGGGVVGAAGRVRPTALDAPEWARPAFALEFLLSSVRVDASPAYRDLSTYPAVRRDLAFTIDRDVPAGDVEAAVREVAPDSLERLRLFDVYRGEEIEEGRRSLAWRFVFRAPDRTLEDREVEEAMSRIVDELEERYGIRVRAS